MNSIFRYFVVRAAILLLLMQGLTGCEKLVEVDAPVTSINGSNVYAGDATAIAVLTGIYTKISNADMLGGGVSSLSLFPGLSADEFTLFGAVTNPVYVACYQNALTNANAGVADYWMTFYQYVYLANAAIEGLSTSNTLTPAIKQQLLGEAKFIRAFCYSYLVALYGEVPLAVTTDYDVNTHLSRSTVDKVWAQIITDLKEAHDLLAQHYLDGSLMNTTTERVRPTKSAAAALLARAYLYSGDWTSAELFATEVINNTGTYSLGSDLGTVFLANNPEAIWQFQPVNFGENTPDGKVFVLPEGGPSDPSNPVYLSNYLLNSFEPGDRRRKQWIDSIIANNVTYYYPYKYKVSVFGEPVSEYETVLRLGEQYLIRAEARAELGHAAEAIADLNNIRQRASLPGYTGASDKASLLKAILHERQVELFTEWGHRWLDLKRTGNVNDVMSKVAPSKGGVWSTNWQLFPIALTELQRQPNLVQNTGY